MNEAYIVKSYRSAVTKSGKGGFNFTRPDELAAKVIKYLMEQVPQLDKSLIDDVIVGNAMPEAEQGLNMGRFISILGLNTVDVPGVTVNRYCASGLESIAIATAKIRSGMADIIIAGGVESMTYIPMGGYRPTPSHLIAKDNPDYYWGMGITAEEVAKKYNVSREDQDAFALNSHKNAFNALQNNLFKDQIVPVEIEEIYVNDKEKRDYRTKTINTDEGVRADTSIEKLNGLRPVFSMAGSVTAGNSSQTSDGAAFSLIVSERMLKELELEPIARLKGYSVAGVEPSIMGIGPVKSVPKALKQVNMSLNDIGVIELNEAFASQSLAVIRELGLNPDLVNPNGGAIALGHPLGCTGAKLTTQAIYHAQQNNINHAMVTMCVGTGQGATGILEVF